MSQMKKLKLKITKTKFKNSVDGLTRRTQGTEETNGKLQSRIIDPTQSEQQRENRLKKVN